MVSSQFAPHILSHLIASDPESVTTETLMKLEQAPYYIPAHEWDAAGNLPERWQWQPGWKFVKRLRLTNSTELVRNN